MPVHVRGTHSTKVRGYFPVSAGTAGPKNRGPYKSAFHSAHNVKDTAQLISSWQR
jgi:hypothetical protein